MCAYEHVCMYACASVRMLVCICVCISACSYVYIYVCMNACMYVGLSVFLHVDMSKVHTWLHKEIAWESEIIVFLK